jgi:hypothetical protein
MLSTILTLFLGISACSTGISSNQEVKAPLLTLSYTSRTCQAPIKRYMSHSPTTPTSPLTSGKPFKRAMYVERGATMSSDGLYTDPTNVAFGSAKGKHSSKQAKRYAILYLLLSNQPTDTYRL